MANYQSIHSGSNIDYVISNALLQSTAASIYLTKTDAADAYLTQSDATNIYLTQSNASNIYLTKVDANTLYPLKDGTGASGTWNITANKLANNGSIGTDVRHDGRTIIVRPNDMPIVENVASYYSDASSITGTMKITLPTTSGECIMQMMEVWVYDYNSNSGSILCIAGYTYTDNKWYNYSCRILGHYSKGCRLAYDGTHACILLGTTSTIWNYPKVWIPRWMAGYGERMSIVNKGLPTIDIITSESGYTITGSAT